MPEAPKKPKPRVAKPRELKTKPHRVRIEEQRVEICERLAKGESLASICRLKGMPSQTTVFRWIGDDDVFRENYARARELQADSFVDEIVNIADTEIDPNRARVRIDARKWTAGKLRPKVYGDRVEVDLNAKIENEDTGALLAELSRALGVSVDEARKMVGFAPGENAG